MKIIDVNLGEIKIVKGNGLLRALSLGSCIAIVFYDAKNKLGGLAHVMLPGKSPKHRLIKRKRYAINAIDALLKRIINSGANEADIKVSIVGGGNVLKIKNDDICRGNICSVIGYLKENNLEIVGSSVGGFQRRSVSVNVENGDIVYTLGNSAQKIIKKNNLQRWIGE